MAGPQNGIVGDGGFDLPSTGISPEQLAEEQNLAKFSKSKEFQKMEEYCKKRIEFYRNLPASIPDWDKMTYQEKGMKWEVSSIIMAEFEGLLGTYANAREVVKEIKNA